jgi:hypothetical protein
MPLRRAMTLSAALLGLALAGCASQPPSAPETPVQPLLAPVAAEAEANAVMRAPREIRLGQAEMVIQRVESDVSRDEVFAAVERMLAQASICIRWPPLWIEDGRRASLVVRYDLMARDWGEVSVADAQAWMDEFVEAGFLISSALPNTPGAFSYQLTAEGEQRLSGIIEPGRRPSFCGLAERRLVEITEMEWGDFPCGSLLVRFSHVADDWPSWARAETTRARLAAGWPPVGVAATGSVSLSRQWYRRGAVPPGFANGSLHSACFDARRQRIVGDDLNLTTASR